LEAEMKKTSQPHNDVASSEKSLHWSIASSQLTAKGGAELLRLFGAKLEECYAQTIEESLPDQFQFLVAQLDAVTKTQE
jgi:hypothetical protein